MILKKIADNMEHVFFWKQYCHGGKRQPFEFYTRSVLVLLQMNSVLYQLQVYQLPVQEFKMALDVLTDDTFTEQDSRFRNLWNW